ncbi:taste receptor type 2 member 40-like [Discoglossus pictus]
METILLDVRLAVSAFECAAGLLNNLYIIAINVLDWKRGNKLNPCDLIQVFMAVNNICLQGLLNVFIVLFIVFPASTFSNKNVTMSICILLMFLLYISFWFTAWLCVYYCLKIASFKHSLFIHLKLNISTLMPKLLLVSAVGSFAISIFCIWNVHLEMFTPPGNVTATPTLNNIYFLFNPPFKFITLILGGCLPLLLVVSSIALTLRSILRHVETMKNNSSIRHAHMDAHLRAAKIMILLTINFVTFYIAEVLLLSRTLHFKSLLNMISLFYILIYPTVQSTILILGNSKLKGPYLQILHCSSRG